MTSSASGEPLAGPVVWAGLPEVSVKSGSTSIKQPDTAAGHGPPTPGGDLNILFDRYSRLVLRIARRVLGDPNEAEDVVQEVFLYLYRRPDVFNPSKGSLKAWIIQITSCRALDRKLHLARQHLDGYEQIDSLELQSPLDLEKYLDAKLSRKQLERAFSELTDLQRRTIEFFYFEGLELKEISALLRKPLGTVRHHFYRGLKRLRKNSLLHRLL